MCRLNFLNCSGNNTAAVQQLIYSEKYQLNYNNSLSMSQLVLSKISTLLCFTNKIINFSNFCIQSLNHLDCFTKKRFSTQIHHTSSAIQGYLISYELDQQIYTLILYLLTKIISMATQLVRMTEQHTHQVADLLTRNFLSNNPIWKSFNLDNQQVFKFFVNQIRLHLDSQAIVRQQINPNIEFNMVYFHQGKIIAAGFNFELHEYLKVSSLPGQSETLKHFEVLQNYGKKLFDSLKIEEHQKGKHIYGSFIVIDQNVDKEVKKAFRNKAIMSTYKNFINQGFKSLILRTSHIGSQKIYLSLGAQIVSEVQFELKGEKFQLKLLKLEFNNPIFSKMMGL